MSMTHLILIGGILTANVLIMAMFLHYKNGVHIAEVRPNILGICLIGAAFLGYVTHVFGSDSNLVSGLVGAFIGGMVGVLDKLASPAKPAQTIVVKIPELEALSAHVHVLEEKIEGLRVLPAPDKEHDCHHKT